jgi:hypothetical protein
MAGNEHKYFGCVTEAVVAKGEPVQEVVRNMVQEDHPLADASQQIEPQVTFTGACQNSGAGLSKVLVHALNLSQKHIGKTGPRKTDTCFVAALKSKKGSFLDPALMQIKDAAATGRQHQSARSPVKEGVGLSPIGQRVKPGALS